jgi:hypothetical protein
MFEASLDGPLGMRHLHAISCEIFTLKIRFRELNIDIK